MPRELITKNRVLFLRASDVACWPHKQLSEITLEDANDEIEILSEFVSIVIFLPEDCGEFTVLKDEVSNGVACRPIYKRDAETLHYVIMFGVTGHGDSAFQQNHECSLKGATDG